MARPIIGSNDEEGAVPPFTDPEQEQDPETQRAIQQLIDRSQPWRQPAPAPTETDWREQTPEEFLADGSNPPLDFHTDDEALTSISCPSAPRPRGITTPAIRNTRPGPGV